MNADELKKDVIAAMNAAVCGALDTGSLIDIEATAQNIADKYAQLSAQSVSAVQPFGWVNSVNAEFTRKTGGSVALWPKKYDDTDLALYTRSADADAVDAKKGAEIIAAAKNLVAVKGRHHSEQAYKRLAAAIAAQSTEGAKG